MKKLLTFLFIIFISINAYGANPFYFEEIWAYVTTSDENSFKPTYPITDIGYFAAEINSFGKLVNVPNRKKIKGFSGRVHLVVAQVSNRALTHFAIDPSLPIRDVLIEDILKAASSFDGVQIDFEHVAPQDRYNFYSFLFQLKSGLGDKPLSIALGARTKYLDDAYEYAKIAQIVDKILIMAYDEHWSSSAPGSVASLAWCKRVAEYAVNNIPLEKLIMGIPFYSRAWASANLSKAYKHSGVKKLIADKNIVEFEFNEEVPFFKYQEIIDVVVYYENFEAVLKRAAIYDSMQIDKIGFWRLGQEDIQVWQNLKTNLPKPNTIKQRVKSYLNQNRKPKKKSSK